MKSDTSDYPIPENEEERLKELNRYRILDTPPEESFDRLTNLATELFDVPIALVSLIDDDRQWWKSCVGVDTRGTDRSLAFCNYPLVERETIVIPDATRDDRVRDNELVTGEMNIRFYAGSPLKTDNGYILGTFCVIDTESRDFSEKQVNQLETLADEAMSQMELRLTKHQIEERNQDLRIRERSLSAIKEGITITDPQQKDNPIVFVNDGFTRITGYEEEEALGRNCRFLQGEETDPEKVKQLRSAIDNEESVNIRVRNYRKDGTIFWNDLTIHPVNDENGETTHFVGIQEDVTQLVEMQQALEYKASYDELTGLLNRDTFIRQLQTSLVEENDHGVLVLLDLDHFSDINDRYGHVVGDRVLEATGDLLKRLTKDEDLVGRYGGEEFGFFRRRASLDQTKKIAERIRAELRDKEFETEQDETFSVTASFGVTETVEHEESVEQSLNRADNALYESKEHGRDCVTVKQP